MKLLSKIALFILPALLVLSGCGAENNYVESSFFAMDTVISFKVSEGEYDEVAIIAECEKLLSDLENVISKTVDGSDVFIANTDIDMMLKVDPVFEELLKLSLEYSEMTEGAFDITVGTLKELWEDCSKAERVPTSEEIGNALSFVGFEGLSIDNSTLEKSHKETALDFGAVGKGYGAQKIAELLEKKGVGGAILSFGGNVALVGSKQNGKPYKVGVKDPQNPDGVIGYLSLDGGFVSVSGDYERYIEIGEKKYNHIIDPNTGFPVDNGVHSVCVVSDDGPLADALSTALFVMGKDKAMDFYSSEKCDFEAVFVTEDGVFATAGLQGVLTPKKGVKIVFEGDLNNGD